MANGAGDASLIQAAADLLLLGIRAAAAYGRPDLEERLQLVRARLGRPEVHVAVVGEFKAGKSHLVNALVGLPVCPVDDGWSTTVATLVRWGDAFGAVATFEPDDEGVEPRRESVDPSQLTDLVTEVGNLGNQRGLRLVEVTVPRPVLRSGLVLLDTPGAGGLLSPLVAPTLAALPGADVVLFCTSAAQELTRPEIDLLRAVVATCPTVLVGLTRTDLYVEWPRIAELDRGHLAASGLDLPVIPLSSVVRDVAVEHDDPNINVESGFVELGQRIRDVVSSVEQLHLRTAATEVAAAAAQMATAFEGEQAALADPESANRIAAQLELARERAERLRVASARWLQRLNDGIGDLTADVEHGLRQRLRRVLEMAEGGIDTSDPAESFDAMAMWLQQQVTAEIGMLYGEVASRADELAASVAGQFDEDRSPIAAASPVTVDLGELVHAIEISDQPERGDKASALGLTALRGGYMSMLMFGTLGSLAGLTMLNPAVGVAGVIMGRKAVRDEQKRQLTLRRQQAKGAARKFVDEVSFRVNKDIRDTLRRVHRELRDQFTSRAEESVRSANRALQAAQQSVGLAEQDRSRRLNDVQAELRRLAELRRRASTLLDAATASVPAGQQ